MTMTDYATDIKRELPPGLSEYYEDFSQLVAAGLQHFAITLTQGTRWFIKDIYIYCAGAGAGARFEVARGTVGTHTNIALAGYGETYGHIVFNADPATINDGTVIAVNTASAGAETVYITVHYYYE